MLYVVMLGGRHPKANIEVHDVVFAWASSLEEAYPQLRDAWFGSAKGLHIDSWMEVEGVEGWRIEASSLAPGPGAKHLYLLNLGGYERQVFGEAHDYQLVVASDKNEARRLGKARMPAQWLQSHTDAVIDIDDCLPIDLVAGRYLYLVEGAHRPVKHFSRYIVLF